MSYDHTARAGGGWRPAKSLLTLRDQIDAKYPGRDKSSDGMIGDVRHQQEHSEHNPDHNGVVRAEDISNDPKHGVVSDNIAHALIDSRDPRILYVISNRKICSSAVSPWVWRDYRGSNPHDHHFHLSVVADPKLYDDTKPWAAISGAVITKPIDPPTKPLVAGLTPEIIDKITVLAAASDLAHVSWKDRGSAPRGYIKGMAVSFALVYSKWKAGNSAAMVMAAANKGNETDALALYSNEFLALNMHNSVAGADTLRHLFVLLIGLGMRESSGRYCEGRDRSASNTSADSAEAGLFQMSWNARVASVELPRLFDAYSARPDGFLSIFAEGVSAKPGDLENYGTGEGAGFQKLCKSCPAFAVEAAAVGLRTIRKHWGPINRQEAEIRPEADKLLRQVQQIVDAQGSKPSTAGPVVGTGLVAAGGIAAIAHWFGAHATITVAAAAIAGVVVMIVAGLVLRPKKPQQ